MDAKSLLIGALIVAVGVLGYLYYDAQDTDAEVDLGAASGGHAVASPASPA